MGNRILPMSRAEKKIYFFRALLAIILSYLLTFLATCLLIRFIILPYVITLGMLFNQLLVLSSIFLLLPEVSKKYIEQIIYLKNFKKKYLFEAIKYECMILPVMIFTGYIMTIIFQLLGIEIKTPFITEQIRSASAFNFLILSILAILLAPLSEELVFRVIGYMFFSRYLRIKKRLSAFLSAFIFSFLHGEFIYMPALFVLGLALQGLFLKNRSITPSIMLHSLHNTIVLCVVKIIQ